MTTQESSNSIENLSQDGQSSESDGEEEEEDTNDSPMHEPSEELDSALKRARDADRFKGQAVAKQLVGLMGRFATLNSRS